MDLTIIKNNADTLTAEMQWLSDIIDTRMKLYWNQPCEYRDISEVIVPDLGNNPSPYANILKHYQLNQEERIILLLALAPHIQPQLLDVFFVKNVDYDRGF